ncbi:uncharacterized protein DMENIID0001_093620 [Sergentomyia squamirostris]
MEDSGIDSGEINEKMIMSGSHESEETSSNEDEIEVIFRGVPSSASSKTTYMPPTSSCRMMQRKLELKVERAKMTYQKFVKTEECPQSKSSNIIPINRLQIPGHVDNQPLVEYKSDHSDEEASPSFFALPKHLKKQDFSDTFSLQELPVSNSEDEDDSQTLELVPPTSEERFLTKLSNLFCCSN